MDNRIYNSLNLIAILLTGIIFVMTYLRGDMIFSGMTANILLVLICTAVLVHTLKAFRLFFELYEEHMPLHLFIRQYCKVIPISMIIPCKLGDVFRAYCFGYHIHNYMFGAAVIIMDRFVDTFALVTLILLLSFAMGVKLTVLFFFMIFFLILLLICYAGCPAMCAYWNRYFIRSRATKRSITILRIIASIQSVYIEIKSVVTGKILITYILSLLAWICEIGGIVLAGFIMDGDTSVMISGYLTGALMGDKTEYLNWFICMSVILLLCLYLLIFFIKIMGKGKEHA